MKSFAVLHPSGITVEDCKLKLLHHQGA